MDYRSRSRPAGNNVRLGRRYTVITACLALLGVVLIACTNTGRQPSPTSSPSVQRPEAAAVNKSELCKVDAAMNAAANTASTPADALAVIRSFEPKFENALPDAPSAIKPDAQALIDGLRTAMQQNDPNAAPDAALQAGYRLNSYCGIKTS
jgi:hypothetical protein